MNPHIRMARREDVLAIIRLLAHDDLGSQREDASVSLPKSYYDAFERIDASYRSQGLGETMIQWAINKAREEGCHLVQLTMDKQRKDTIQFYQKLGFVASHEGLKLFVGQSC